MKFVQDWGEPMKRLLALVLAVMAALAALFVSSSSANAASYPKGVYTPEASDDQIVGKANMSTNCEGTLGCYTYVKLQYKADLADWAQAVPAISAGNDWQDAGGHWANDGWNTVVYDPSNLRNPFGATGCGELRMVALSYNDMVAGPPVNVSLSVGVGHVSAEFGLGDSIRRFETKAVSDPIRVCPFVA